MIYAPGIDGVIDVVLVETENLYELIGSEYCKLRFKSGSSALFVIAILINISLHRQALVSAIIQNLRDHTFGV